MSISTTNITRNNGTAERDFVHVEDLATAYVLALEKLLGDTAEAGSFDPLNLGAGRCATVREVIATAKEVLRLECPIEEQATQR